MSFSSGHCLRVLAAACFLVVRVPSLFAQAENGCQGVGYSKQAFTQHSPEKLRQRLAQNPTDVDALVNLGIHLEEQDQSSEAEALYERAIKARPDCYLGYYFSGLAQERISKQAATDAEAKILKAMSLDPSLRNDPNVQGFFKAHPRSVGGGPPSETRSPLVANGLLTSSSRFLVGVGFGLLLASPIVYLARRKQLTAP